jgi:hypothetical protein
MGILIPLSRHFSGSGPGRSKLIRCEPKRARPFGLAVSLLALLPVLVFSAGQAESEARERYELLEELAPDSLTYNVVPGAAVVSGIPDGQRAILGGYIRILRDILSDIPLRYLSDAERREVMNERVARERHRLSGRIDERLRELDRKAMEDTSEPSRSERPSRSRDETITTLQRRLDLLNSLTFEEFAVPETASLSVPEDDAYVYRRTMADPSGPATEAEADLFLYILVRPLDELYILTVQLYSPVTGTSREVLRVIAPPEEVSLQLEQNQRKIVHAVAAREVADVTIEAVHPDGHIIEEARLYLEDRLIGVGRGRDAYLPEGVYEISGITPHGRERRRHITVEPGETVTLPLLFPEEAPSYVTLTTTPAGAAVYRGVEWQGRTPLRVPRPTVPTSYSVVMEDFYDSRIEIGPDTEDFIDRVLISREYDWESDTKMSRDRFYRSFGWFALSVGAPILLYGTYQDYYGLFPGGVARSDLSDSESRRLVREANTVFYSYYGSIVLSGGLFANMIWRLVDYVKTAQGYHTR